MESYKSESSSYVFCSISSSFLSFQFVRSANVTVHAQVCGLFCVLFNMIVCGFIQAEALNLRALPIIVHPTLQCRHHCFFAMLSGFLETVNSLALVRRLVTSNVN